MCESGPGTGVLVPTGKHAPAVGVDYEISHYFSEAKEFDGKAIKYRRAAVKFVAERQGHPIPLGDYDLIIGDEIVRLKHTAGDPAWLVLSSDA